MQFAKPLLAAFALGSMKILLVDDHALIRDALRSVLRELVADSDECGQPFRLKAASDSDRLRTAFR